MGHVPQLMQLGVCGDAVLDKKPSLIALYAKLRDEYPHETVRKAMQRAASLREVQIAHFVRDVDKLIQQLSNRDDFKKGRHR